MSAINQSSIHAAPAGWAERRTPIRIRIAQGLLLLTGLVTMAGATYFGLINPDENYAWWLTAIFAPAGFALGAARVVAAVRCRRSFTIAVVAAALTYTALKVVLFGETEALTFGALDLVVLALVARPTD